MGIVFFVATTALAQQSIKINEPVGRQLSSGSVQSYAIELKAGFRGHTGRTDHGTGMAQNEKPVTLHQANRDGGAQRGKATNAGCNGLWMSKFQRGRAIATIRAKYPSTNKPPTRNFHHFLVPVVWLTSAVRQAKMRMRCPIPPRGTIIVSTCRT